MALAEAPPPQRTVLERHVLFGGGVCDKEELTSSVTHHEKKEPEDDLRLLFLGCEENFPYGPSDHTAALFLDLICRALVKATQRRKKPLSRKVSISVYHAQNGDFPKTTDEWNSFSGFILPGSFSSAYDSDPWILNLKTVIQEELVGRERPTLGICFGHQLYAHSFQEGCAIKCPAGQQAGRKTFESTDAGNFLFGIGEGNNANDKRTIGLFYTHGDMVEQLPKQGVSLGGNESVPIQSAAYFRTEQEAEQFLAAASAEDNPINIIPKPIAVTFQAHPEYASPRLGLTRTFGNVLKAMADRCGLSQSQKDEAEVDAKENYDEVEQHSIDVIIAVGRQLGWFPTVQLE